MTATAMRLVGTCLLLVLPALADDASILLQTKLETDQGEQVKPGALQIELAVVQGPATQGQLPTDMAIDPEMLMKLLPLLGDLLQKGKKYLERVETITDSHLQQTDANLAKLEEGMKSVFDPSHTDFDQQITAFKSITDAMINKSIDDEHTMNAEIHKASTEMLVPVIVEVTKNVEGIPANASDIIVPILHAVLLGTNKFKSFHEIHDILENISDTAPSTTELNAYLKEALATSEGEDNVPMADALFGMIDPTQLEEVTSVKKTMTKILTNVHDQNVKVFKGMKEAIAAADRFNNIKEEKSSATGCARLGLLALIAAACLTL